MIKRLIVLALGFWLVKKYVLPLVKDDSSTDLSPSNTGPNDTP